METKKREVKVEFLSIFRIKRGLEAPLASLYRLTESRVKKTFDSCLM